MKKMQGPLIKNKSRYIMQMPKFKTYNHMFTTKGNYVAKLGKF